MAEARVKWLLLYAIISCLLPSVCAGGGSGHVVLTANGASPDVYVTEGTALDLECKQGDGGTIITSVTCQFTLSQRDDILSDTTLWTGAVTINRNDHNGKTCTCKGINVYYKDEKEVTIFVASRPTIAIQDCPTFVDSSPAPLLVGSSDSCTCAITDVFPDGAATEVQWLSPDGTPVATGSTTAVLRPQPSITDPSNITCVAINNVEAGTPRRSETIPYLHSPPFGPDTVTVQAVAEFSLCTEDSLKLPVTCSYPVRSVAPGADVELSGIPGAPTQSDNVTQEEGSFVHNFRFRPTQAGDYEVKCSVSNEVNPALMKEATQTVSVIEPSQDPPQITVAIGESNTAVAVTNGQVVTATLGQTAEVKCLVEREGFGVFKISLSCGDVLNQTQATESSVQVPLLGSPNPVTCRCRGSHPHGCYDQTSQFSLEVQPIPPVITDFSVNGFSNSLEIAAGTNVEFVCKAQGFPAPEISIKGQHSGLTIPGETTPLDTNAGKFQQTKQMACSESDTYVCTSDNTVGSPVKQSVTVLVTCPPELYVLQAASSNQVVPVLRKRSGLFQAVFYVVSRPHPTSYVLVKLASQGGLTKRAVRYVEIDKERYTIQFEEVNPAYDQITLDVFDMEVHDDDQYRLDVANGMGPDLQIYFVTDVEDDAGTDQTNSGASTTGLIAAGCVAAVLLIIVVAIFVYFHLWLSKAKKPSPKTKTRSRRKVMVV